VTLHTRLADALAIHHAEVKEWDQQRALLRAEIERRKGAQLYAPSTENRKRLRVAWLELRQHGDRPVESIAIGMLRGRIARQEGLS